MALGRSFCSLKNEPPMMSSGLFWGRSENSNTCGTNWGYGVLKIGVLNWQRNSNEINNWVALWEHGHIITKMLTRLCRFSRALRGHFPFSGRNSCPLFSFHCGKLDFGQRMHSAHRLSLSAVSFHCFWLVSSLQLDKSEPVNVCTDRVWYSRLAGWFQ